MPLNAITLLRRLTTGLWLALFVVVVLAVVVGHGAPLLGYRLVIVQGPSMGPAIPVGALTFEQDIAPVDLRPGDVVTFTMPNGAVITHRIVQIVAVDGVSMIETKGDANATADATVHPASGVSGVVRSSMPYAGFLYAFLTLPTGMLSVLSMLGCLLLTVWLLEDLERESRAGSNVEDRPLPVTEPLVA